MMLTWVSGKPKSAGWYWVKLEPDHFKVIVRVAYPILGPDNLVVLDYYGGRRPLADGHWDNALWYGPLEEPQP
jgi:hypothetical protein